METANDHYSAADISKDMYRSSQRGRDSSERGAALVEFALVAPVLLALLLLILSVGSLYNQKLNLTYAAREGARYGSTHALTDQTWASTVRNVVVARSSGDLTISDVCVSLVSGRGSAQKLYEESSNYGTQSGPCIVDDGDAAGGTRVQVTVTRQGKMQALITSQDVTLNASAVGAYEQ